MFQAIMESRISQSNSSKNFSTVKFVAAAGGIGGGLLLMLTGVILSAVSFFDRVSFHGLEVILIIAAFILMAIGAHFLDLIDKEKKARKIEFCKKHGLSEKECLEQKYEDARFN